MGYSAEEIITEIERRPALHAAPPEKEPGSSVVRGDNARQSEFSPIPTESAAPRAIVAS